MNNKIFSNWNKLSLAIGLISFTPLALAQSNTLESIVVTADRQQNELRDIPASIYAVDSDRLESISHVHIGEVLNTIPGIVFNRGNGQESLLGIRSPVITGSGGCGSLQMSQDGIPLRGAGFCNVNQLFEANSEQAQSIEVVRGPGSILFGVNALHGAINIITPGLSDETGGNVSVDAGPHEYARVKVGLNNNSGDHAFGVYFNGASDGGYLDDSGYDQQKLNLSHQYDGDGISITTVFSATNLNQETAGYLVAGPKAYENSSVKKSNPNPEAFRDAQGYRLHSQIQGDTANGSWMLTPYYRDTEMTFLMHFLPGTPLEENGHESFGLQTMYSANSNGSFEWIAGVDMELTNGYLRQTQAFGFGSFPTGKQYDFEVDAQMLSPYAVFTYQSSDSDQLTLGLRYEFLEYDYNNLMVNGNTAEDGVTTCTPSAFNPAGTCRYSRPADRVDSFDNVTAQLGWIHDFESSQQFFTNGAFAFRAPQSTELYRLQQNQLVADLKSEEVSSFEVGYRASRERISYSLAAYYMQKDNVIFQDSSRRNVSGGATEHKGIEFDTLFSLSDQLSLNATASYARHTYESNIAPNGVSVVIDGNEIDTAPKLTGSAQLNWQINAKHSAVLEWIHMGSYFTNESNLNKYDGHDLLNLRYQYDTGENWHFAARVTNLLDTDYAERADWTSFVDDRYFVGEPIGLYFTIGNRF